ncbi:lactate utilisation protein LutB domain-containing protein, partial [Desulfosarcina sp.]|uniref:lactate utilisation protein LutB domain-containing protein n=1 Tax=Desulfosarcina sp. TaxID=2027861 RepID=UPI003568E0C5
PRMLLLLRAKLAEGDASWHVGIRSRAEQAAFTAWSFLIRNRFVYELFLKGASIGQQWLPGRQNMISRLPFGGKGWTQSRDLRRLAPRSFIQRYRIKGADRKEK